MPLATEISQEPTLANPPRYRWLKRIGLLVVLVLLALGVLRWWWGHVAQVRLQRVIDAAHARGEPILPEDFTPQSIPEGQNAAVTLQLAAAAIVRDPNSDAMDNDSLSGPFTPLEVNRTDAVAANNGRALRLVRQARSQPRADWGLVFHSPIPPNYSLRYLNTQRELASIQKWVALGDHAKGKDAEPLERALDLLHQADALQQGTSVVITYLVSIGISALTTDLLERITPDLRVTAHGPPTGGTASAGQVRAVIARLLDERGIRGGAVRAWEGERMQAFDQVDSAAAGRSVYVPYAIARLVGPMFTLDGTRVADDMSQAMASCGLPNWPAAKAARPTGTPSANRSEIGSYVHLLSDLSVGWRDRPVQIMFQAITERRALAIELALRLYRLDHGGKLPAKLSQLVPDYLSALPADPMTADGRTFAYHPNARPPVIYSVGFDGIDNGGTSIADETLGQYRWRMADAVYPLELPPPSTQPSTPETQDNQ